MPHKLPCEKVIEENIGLVKQIVKRFNVSKFDEDDLMQAGLIGLWKAAYHFDEERGYKFSSYAVKYILGSIKEELKKLNIIKISRKYYKIINELKNTESIDEDVIMERFSCTKYDIALAYAYSNGVLKLDESELPDTSGINISKPKQNKLYILIKKLKDKENLNQKEIAQRLLISQSTVSRILNKNIDLDENI